MGTKEDMNLSSMMLTIDLLFTKLNEEEELGISKKVNGEKNVFVWDGDEGLFYNIPLKVQWYEETL